MALFCVIHLHCFYIFIEFVVRLAFQFLWNGAILVHTESVVKSPYQRAYS